ncbi:pyroglutamyl-peptidase I [Microbacterium sp. ARD32]|uniref:pyroglutamyl-peptidase I family protein n=1 Tax=Microbacterium sp. ARD32 TaxID=2962577 RepID=UPI0028817365|nr:pyroglutamyl-peptidase I [Microbacterium sp. ARD32]MDT0156891.1 pyroglutamyl-peptidase I [Microbacterium sp. ARD32]
MATILLTGFAPFDGADRNPSADAVDAVAAGYDGLHRLISAVLPVSFAGAAARLRALIAEHDPDAVIATGLAGGSDRVAVERVGVNLMDACIPDDDGEQPVDVPSEPDGPAARFATLPVKRIVGVLEEAGIPVRASLSAGSYVCNHVLYTALGASHPDVPTGFVHLPWTPATAPEDAPSLSEGELARAVRLIVDHAFDPDDLRPGGSIW